MVVHRPRVLFLCTHNSARSQMAEGLLRELSGHTVEVLSAGTISSMVRPEAIQVMSEIGIDIRHQYPKTMDGFIEDQFDFVITVCDSANETCPVFPNAGIRWHWSIADPPSVEGTEAQRMAAFRDGREDLKQRIENELLPELIEPGS